MDSPREVWVSDATRHAPAHRITRDIPIGPDNPTCFQIACPPHVTFGGTALTRADARALEVHPCARCFTIPPTAAFPPPPPPAPA